MKDQSQGYNTNTTLNIFWKVYTSSKKQINLANLMWESSQMLGHYNFFFFLFLEKGGGGVELGMGEWGVCGYGTYTFTSFFLGMIQE